MIISICNQKGGVGKTTTAINLAGILSKSHHRTLLVDLDPQGHVSTGLNLTLPPDRPSVYEVMRGDVSLSDAIANTFFPNLKVLPSDIRLSTSDIEFSRPPFVGVSSHLLKRALVGSGFEYIVIDCPPSLGIQSINALVASDGVIIPLQCEFLALEGVSALVETIEEICSTLDNSLEIFGILPSMFQKRTRVNQQVLDKAAKTFAHVYPPVKRTIRFANASIQGVPINYFTKDLDLISPYTSIMRDLLCREKENR